MVRDRLLAVTRAWSVVPMLAGTIMAASGTASALPITDPINDFVPTFLGPHNADLDVVSAEVFLDPNNFILHAVLNGPVGTTPGGFFVWGFNRGAGTQGFPIIAPGVLFDRVVLVRANGTTNAPGGTVLINGNDITGLIPRAFMPSTGFLPEDYTWNLWPRSPAIPGNPDGNLSDFAPDNSNAAISALPEPSSLALFGFGIVIVGAWRKRLRRARVYACRTFGA